MLKNTRINLKVIERIALALAELNEQVIYVGGAVVSLYINDPSASDVRPTKDLDISLAITSLAELEAIREDLVRKGFKQSPEDDVICRFRYEDIKVDIMNTETVAWAPANPWFGPGFKQKEMKKIQGRQIHILPLTYFLASKFAAFSDRGAIDPRTSHDFEDIVYILDNRIDIVEQFANAPNDVKPFLLDQLKRIRHERVMQEAILGHLYYDAREARYQRIMKCINQLLE